MRGIVRAEARTADSKREPEFFMNIGQKAAAKRIFVRVAIVGVLSYFLVTASTFNSIGQAQDPAPEQAEKAQPQEAPAVKEEAPAAPVVPAAKEEAPASKEDAFAKAKDTAWKLLEALSKNISSTPQAVDTSLSAEVSGLAVTGEKTLGATLSDPAKAGKMIHQLRMKGLVPAVSIKWLEAGTEGLLGVVTLKDGRHRSVKVVLDPKSGLVNSIDRPTPKDLKARALGAEVLKRILSGDVEGAWADASPVPTFFDKDQKGRSAAQFKSDLEKDHLLKIKTDDSGQPMVEWEEKDSQIEGGYRINGVATIDHEGTDVKVPLFSVFLDGPEGLRFLDIQSKASFTDRFFNGTGDGLDLTLFIVLCALAIGMFFMLFQYYMGLRESPREIWLLFFTKVTEYSAYGAAQLAFMFYLRDDMGLSDIGAGTYYSAWSTGLTCLTMVVGAVCDAIGVKRTLLVGAVCLMLSRAVMPFAGDILMATVLGFIPLAIGIAITGPVLSVGVKKFTTMEGAAMGFAAFYTLMNVGWALGAWIFDTVRIAMGELGSVEVFGADLSTYEVILGIGFFLNLPDFVAILLMRRGVEMTESGIKFEKFEKKAKGGNFFSTMASTFSSAAKDTVSIFGQNFVQRAFWIFILLIGVTVFARLTFFHFHLTWPSYGARYLGQGSLVGNLFGVWNPVLIVLLTPLMGLVTRKISSYKMLLVGTIISVGSIVFVVVDQSAFVGLGDTWLGAIIFDRWLEVPEGFRDPFYMGMFLFVTAFTVGEAIWSPRLMQFTAEIAPPGREGSYVALSYLPYFGAKFIAGPMAGWLLTTYTPEFGIEGVYMNYPNHQLIWWWIAGTAALTPIGLVGFRKMYAAAEARAKEAALAAAAEADQADAAEATS